MKRLWSVRSCLLLLDFEDDSADSIKELLLKTTFSPLFLKSQEVNQSTLLEYRDLLYSC